MKARHFELKIEQEVLHSAKNIYFVGIGGVSMSGLAHMTLHNGKNVWGCDRQTSVVTQALAQSGAHILEDGTPLPPACDLLVYSLAIPQDHPALLDAKRRGIPLISRGEYLAFIANQYPTHVAVAGCHGKSTVVGMLAHIFTHAGLSPQVAGGAPLSLSGDCYRIGEGEVFLLEACEYKKSFLSLSPTFAVITNLDFDHPDAYPTFSHVKEAFSSFISQSQQVILCGDCPPLMEIAPKNSITYGFSPTCDLRGILVGRNMQVWEKENLLGTIRLRLFGDYNYQNALAAICCGRQMGLPFYQMKQALQSFEGIGRRMEYRGSIQGGRVYLDYAHHPKEIESAILAAKTQGQEVFVIFQPHTYTRTYSLWKEFIAALVLANKTTLVDIYAAREAPIEGVTAERLAREGGFHYAPTLEDAIKEMLPHMKEGAILILMGAGDVPKALNFLKF